MGFVKFLQKNVVAPTSNGCKEIFMQAYDTHAT